MQKDTIQRFIENFNEDFKSNIPIDSYAFLKDIYEQNVGPNISNEFEKQYVKELEKLVDKLYTSFNKQQRVLFN